MLSTRERKRERERERKIIHKQLRFYDFNLKKSAKKLSIFTSTTTKLSNTCGNSDRISRLGIPKYFAT